jgi:hypothetical protein
LKAFAFRRLGSLLAQGHLGEFFHGFSHPGSQRPQWPWSKWTQVLLEMAVDLGIVNERLVLQPQIQGHGGFHLDFKGNPGRPGNVGQGSLQAASESVMCEIL